MICSEHREEEYLDIATKDYLVSTKPAISRIARASFANLLLASLLLTAPAGHADDDLAATMLGHFKTLITVFDTDQPDLAQQQLQASKVIDFSYITHGVLREHRKAMTPEQMSAFQTEFEKSMTNLLRTALQGASDFEVSVEKVQVSSKDPSRARVLGVLTTPRNERFELLTSVGQNGTTWVVRNLSINGINLGLTYRNQFSELLQQHAGDIDATIARWAQVVSQNNSVPEQT